MFVALRSSVLVLILSSLALAADQGDKPAARPQPPTPVNVVKTDGKVVGGMLTKTDQFGMTVKPRTGGEELMVPWREVKSSSNGMTRDKWMARFKLLNEGKLCLSCHGEGVTKCPDCNGTGVDPAQAKPCQTCKGTGGIGKCPTPNCVDGKIPCPRPCLKLSAARTNKEGKKEWVFHGKNGTTWTFSELHEGDVVVMENGDPVDKGKCQTCDGTGKIGDPACKGTGHKLCPDCKGAGVVGPACTKCDHGFVICSECKGTGLAP